MILLVDNFDSFVHNLARYFERLGQRTVVMRNDELNAAAVRRMAPHAVVISPGPGAPDQAGCSVELVRQLLEELPILGVCLGHQAIVEAMGGRTVRAAAPMHGRTSRIEHDGDGLFAGLPSPLSVCRYHSLIAEAGSLPSDLRATARTVGGEIMAVGHVRRPVYGVQFHPEAILTEGGYSLLANFLRAANCEVSPDAAALIQSENRTSRTSVPAMPLGPVTF